MRKVYHCKNCGKGYTYQECYCFECESEEEIVEVHDYLILMEIAEKNRDVEEKHIFADLALLRYVKSTNPDLAKRYEKVAKSGMYYS